ncbi:c-type cytochrome [Kiloniella sp. b19]|uniref:c-type cytochrome n=1 Tax=Kiloniella sp. GXU_MW_B19 TaxID=3141326 RepID=UPI0031E413EB
MSLELNKIAAAVLSAGIIYMGSGFIADLLYKPEDLEKNVYVVDLGDGTATAAPAAEEPQGAEPVSPLLASASVDKGAKLFKKCAACHSVDEGGPNKVGPNLWSIVDRAKASHPGYSYSDVLNGMSAQLWDYEALNEFLYKPKEYAPGTKMSFAGMKKADQRADLIAYLRAQASAPVALPQ